MKILTKHIDKLYDLPCSVYWKDLKGIYRGLNDYAAKTVNGPKENDIFGCHDSDVLTPEVVVDIKEHDNKVIATEKSLIFIEEAKFINKKHFIDYTVLSYKLPFYNQSNKLLGLIALSCILKSQQSLFTLSEELNLIVNHKNLIDIKYGHSKNNSDIDPTLTQRHLDCLYYLVQGKTAKQTANILNLSFRTIEYHINMLKIKFQCQTSSDLIAKALQLPVIKARLISN